MKREIDEELRFHIEQRMADHMAEGMAPEEAAREARKQFGNWQRLREDCRQERGASWGETTAQDVRFGLRMLRRSPGFTAIAVLSLGLGIGAGTAIFSLVNAILLRSLPVPNPHELRVLRWSGENARIPSLYERPEENGPRVTAHSVSHPTFVNLREQAAGQADIFGFALLQDAVARVRGGAFTAKAMMVSDNFFSGLGVRPWLGRLLNTAADYTGEATRVVITYPWWEKHYASDPGVVGQTVMLNGASFTIIGVLPRDFGGVQPGDPSEFYVPMAASSPFLFRPLTEPGHWYVHLMARVRPGVSDARLRATLETVFARQAAALMTKPEMRVEPGHGGLGTDRHQYRQPLLMMLGVVGVVLLVACANLAGLSLARGAARQHELAVRAALGAGRWRLIRQSLTENLVLALLGGGLGVLLAVWGKTAISRLLAGSTEGLRYDLSFDFTVLGFSLAAALLTALLSGLLPAWRASRADPVAGFKNRGALGAPRLKTGKILVAAQICLSLLLLTGAGLYLRTLANLTRLNTGFNIEKLLVFQLSPGGAGYEGSPRIAYYEQVQSALAEIPGVRGAAFLEIPLLDNKASSGGFTFDDRPLGTSENMTTHRLTVGETYFSTLGIPILQGRALSASDSEEAPKAVVVNQTFAQTYLPNQNPIGRMVNIWSTNWHIVGVCQDTRYAHLKETPPPTMYFPFRQRFYGTYRQKHLRDGFFAVRTVLPPLAMATAVRRAVAAVNPNVPISKITTRILPLMKLK